MDLTSTFAKQAKKFRVDFDEIAKEIRHRGTAGGARENALRQLLRNYLPARAGVDEGFVIDAAGGESQQLDVIVYDQTYAAIVRVGDACYFPCESVIAVGQVKTRIDSRAGLTEALDNIASAKALDRSNGGTNLPITGPGYSLQGMRFDPAREYRDQIFGFIFTGVSLAERTLVRHLREWTASHPRTVWPNIYCDHNRSLISYTTSDHLTPSPIEATGLYVTAPSEQDNILLLFVALLTDFVNMAHVARAGPQGLRAHPDDAGQPPQALSRGVRHSGEGTDEGTPRRFCGFTQANVQHVSWLPA